MAYIGRDIQYGTLDKQSFTANSSTTSFSLDSSVLNAKSLLVSVGGVIQEPEVAYTASGSTLTFTEAPATGNSVYAVYLGKTLEVSEGRQSISYQTGTGDGTTTPLTLNASPANAQAIIVALDGIVQTPVTSYSVSGTTLTFAAAPATGVKITVYHMGQTAAIGTIANNSVTDAKITSMNASKLTGTLPANMAVDTTSIDQSIAALGLHVASTDNKVAFNLPNSFIDQFESDSGILTETNVDRLTDEYVASTYTSLGAATYWPYTSNATQTIVDGGNNMNGVPAADNWSVINQGSWPTYLGYWMNSFSYASTYLYVDYLAEYRWTGLKISWHAAHSIVATWRLEHSNDGTNWTVMDQTGTTHADWTGQGFTAGHEDIVTGIDTATGVFTNSNPGHSASKGGSIITFGTPVTSRYLRVGVASIHTNLNDPTAALGAFIPQYQPQTTSTNATGTLISKAQTADAAVSSTSGVMLYEDAEGTGTLGTDLKIYFSSNDGTNWTETASYGSPLTFSGSKKMVKLGKTTLANTGTAVKMKAEWANQAAGQAGASAWQTGNRVIGVTGSTAVNVGNYLNWVDGDTTAAANRAWYWQHGMTVDSNLWVKLDFDAVDGGSGATRVIQEFRYHTSGEADSGVWKWQGSNDDTNWTDVGSNWTMTMTSGWNTFSNTMNNNTTAYRYYRILGVSGSTTAPWMTEIEFKVQTQAAVTGKVQRLHGWAVNY